MIVCGRILLAPPVLIEGRLTEVEVKAIEEGHHVVPWTVVDEEAGVEDEPVMLVIVDDVDDLVRVPRFAIAVSRS